MTEATSEVLERLLGENEQLREDVERLSTPPDEGEECPTCCRVMEKWDTPGRHHKGAPSNQHDRYGRGSQKVPPPREAPPHTQRTRLARQLNPTTRP